MLFLLKFLVFRRVVLLFLLRRAWKLYRGRRPSTRPA
jgi:hypothetical protein